MHHTPPPHQEGSLGLPDQELFYRLFSNLAVRGGRRLLLLHGGGVDGLVTWGGIVAHLTHWDEILVPDLRGTGRTRYPDGVEHAFRAEEVVADIEELLVHLGWNSFDLGGYSYGGLIAMLVKRAAPASVGKTYLLEPGLLGKLQRADLIASRHRLTEASHTLLDLHGDDAAVRRGIAAFLEVVAPGRSRDGRSEEITLSRLARRPVGLGRAIECVSEASERIDRDELIAAQANVSSFVGQRSHPEFHAMCRRIAESRSDWVCHLIQGADHALPFQKPDTIARHMNADRAALP